MNWALMDHIHNVLMYINMYICNLHTMYIFICMYVAPALPFRTSSALLIMKKKNVLNWKAQRNKFKWKRRMRVWDSSRVESNLTQS